MPFAPRSQIEQQKANAPPPPMPVVENYPRKPPESSPPTSPQQTSNTEEQINELNELLVHVLDEISSTKDALYENARKKNKRHKQQHKQRVPQTTKIHAKTTRRNGGGTTCLGVTKCAAHPRARACGSPQTVCPRHEPSALFLFVTRIIQRITSLTYIYKL